MKKTKPEIDPVFFFSFFRFCFYFFASKRFNLIPPKAAAFMKKA